MKRRILLLMMTALLSVGAWAADDLTLNVSETVSFGEWGFDNSGDPTLNFGNWAAGGGWQFETALSQDDYCGVDIAFEATTETHVTFFINYEGGAEQSIDVPTGSTGIKADFAYAGGITKIGFKYGDWEATANPDGCSITITSAVVKAHSTGEIVELAFADLGGTKDETVQSVTFGQYNWSAYWTLSPAILSDDYEKIVVTFAEAIPVDGLTINAEVEGDESWCGTAIGNLTKGATKATAYFSALPGKNITKVGFFLDWQAESATLKIASAKLYKKTEFVRTITDALYATTSFPAAVDFSQTSGIKAYIATVNDAKTKVELTEVTKVAAGVPVILNGSAKDYTLHYTTEDTEDISANELQVSNGTVTGDEKTIYVLANGDNGVGFYLLKNDAHVATGKAYLEVTASSDVRQFIGFGGETAISDIAKGQLSNGQWYNLNGQRIGQPTRGIYIVSGKKVLVK